MAPLALARALRRREHRSAGSSPGGLAHCATRQSAPSRSRTCDCVPLSLGSERPLRFDYEQSDHDLN